MTKLMKLWNCIPIDKSRIVRQDHFDNEVFTIEKLKNGIDYYKYVYENVNLKNNDQNSHIMYAAKKTDVINKNNSSNITGARASIADIDLDIALSFREKIIEYVENKYGSDHCGHIITFNTLDGRGALKEVFRIFGYDAELANSITRKMLDTAKIQDVLEDLKEENPNYTVIHYCIDNIPEIKNAYQDYQKEFNVAIHLSGLIRSLGKHAAGIVISPTILEDTIPIVRDVKTNKLVVAWEMADCEYAGAVKYDFLGVAAYEKIDKIIDMVNNNKKEVVIDV